MQKSTPTPHYINHLHSEKIKPVAVSNVYDLAHYINHLHSEKIKPVVVSNVYDLALRQHG